jgi:hypothetical protein
MFNLGVPDGGRANIQPTQGCSPQSSVVAAPVGVQGRRAALRAAQEAFERSLRQSQQVLVWWCGQIR